MGGFGSGDWSNILTRRAAVEQCRVLSIKQLRLGWVVWCWVCYG